MSIVNTRLPLDELTYCQARTRPRFDRFVTALIVFLTIVFIYALESGGKL